MKASPVALLILSLLVGHATVGEARLGGGGLHGGGSFQRPGGGFHPPAGANHVAAGHRPAAGHPRAQGIRQAHDRPIPQRAAHPSSVQRQRVAQRKEIHGGHRVTVNAGNTVVANRGSRNAPLRPGGGNSPVRPPGPGPRPLPPPPAVGGWGYPVYVDGGWNAGNAIVGGLVAGATAGLVTGAIVGSTQPTYVVPPAGTVVVQGQSASGEAKAAEDAASQAQTAARQAQGSAQQAQDAARTATSDQTQAPPAAPSLPPGVRYAYGTRLAEPPDGCDEAKRGPINFDHCGEDWLQPVMQGGTVSWVAVPPPGE